MRAIDQILERTGTAARQHLQVPEWDLEVWWAPVTIYDQQQLGLQDIPDELSLAAHLIIRKAEDAEGNRLFTLKDIHALTAQVGAAPIARLAAAMSADLVPDGLAPSEPEISPGKEPT